MRLWQKICICTLLFFLIVFFGSSILMIENNVKENFDRVLRRTADEQASISSGMIRYASKNSAKDLGEEGHYQKYIVEYLESRINSQGIYLEVSENGKAIYSNMDIFLIEEETENTMYTVMAQYKVLESDEKKYLRLTSMVTYGDHQLLNKYMVDVTDIYANRDRQYSFFIKLSLGVSVLLIVGIYLIINHLTKSVGLLTKSVRKMKAGNYREQVSIQSKDEIGELAESFNEMASSINEKIADLQRKTEEQQRFIDNFTHELRTPLTAVVGYADLLRSTSFEEEFSQEMGERIFREGKRIQRLSELMMNLVFLEHNSFQLVPCDIGRILNEAEVTLRPALDRMNMNLIIETPKEPLIILAEKNLIINLIVNLADNAGKASEEGDSIWLLAYEEAGSVIVEIEDQGKGIPEEEQSRVFETFYMVDKVRNKKNSGVGLGLSICKDIANVHHAKLELKSKEGEGTIIKIIFPCYEHDTNTG